MSSSKETRRAPTSKRLNSQRSVPTTRNRKLTIDILNENNAVWRSQRKGHLKSRVGEAGRREVESVDVELKFRGDGGNERSLP